MSGTWASRQRPWWLFVLIAVLACCFGLIVGLVLVPAFGG